MTIPADKALAVGKLVHGGIDDEWGICTYSEQSDESEKKV